MVYCTALGEIDMKILGEPIFAKNQDGSLKSRIGTIFFRTPGLVTQRGIHAMQRMAWIRSLNDERAAAGQPPIDRRTIARRPPDDRRAKDK